MGLQRKTGTGIQTQAWQPCPVGTTQLGRESGPHGFGVLPFATWLRKQERLCLEEKG